MRSLRVGGTELIVLPLRLLLQFFEKDPGKFSVLDDGAAVHDHRFEIHPGPVHDHRLDRVDELAHVKPAEVKNRDIRLRTGGKAAKVFASQGIGSPDRSGSVIICCAACQDVFIDHPAQHDARVHVPDEVGRKGIRTQSHIDPPGLPFRDRVPEHGVAAADDRAMDDRRPGLSYPPDLPSHLLFGWLNAAEEPAVGQEGPPAQKSQVLQHLDGRFTEALVHRLDFQPGLTAVKPYRAAEVAACLGRTSEEFCRAAFNAVRSQHAANQTTFAAIHGLHKSDCILKPLQAPLLIPMDPETAIGIDDGQPCPVGRPQVNSQSQFCSDVRRPGKFIVRFPPFPVEQGSDRQGRGNPVQKKLREGITLLEVLFLGGVNLMRAPIHISAGPHPALFPGGAVVEAQHGRIEVGQSVEVDEARPNDSIPGIDRLIDPLRVVEPDEQDGILVKNNLSVLQDLVMRVIPTHDKAASDFRLGHKVSPIGQRHQIRHCPSLAIICPFLTTSFLGALVTIASTRVSP